MDLIKFPPAFRSGCIKSYAKKFKRFQALNGWDDKKSVDVLVTLLPDHLADVVETCAVLTLDGKFDCLFNELDDSLDILTRIDNITLLDDQVDTYISALRQTGGEEISDGIIVSALLRQLSAEMRQSAVLHSDGSLQGIRAHVKAYFK